MSRVKESPCPNCEKVLDEASDPTGLRPKPEPGDITICIYCAQVCEFDSELNLIKLRPEVEKSLNPEEKLAMDTYVAAIKLMKGSVK